MKYTSHRSLSIAALLVIFLLNCMVNAQAQLYEKSYALVMGINKYPSPKWKDLSYARKDAEDMAALLDDYGFEVITLYDEQATKTAIISRLQNYLAPRVKRDDRVLFFFAGHGHTETLGGKDWGYIVPYDGGDESASYISMEELQTQSEKMGSAKHQLFIMDACYGGLLGTREGGVDPSLPNYTIEVTRRVARQILTAGGKDQAVLDRGPGQHSAFTGVLLEALKQGLADLNSDGYTTFAELCSYVVPRASNSYQTPAIGILPGHGLGEFIFHRPESAERGGVTQGIPAVSCTAWVDVPRPQQRTNVTVYGRLLVNDKGVQGAQMRAVWNYSSYRDKPESEKPSCEAITNEDGVASCFRDIWMASIGRVVKIDVTFKYQNELYRATTSFTPSN